MRSKYLESIDAEDVPDVYQARFAELDRFETMARSVHAKAIEQTKGDPASIVKANGVVASLPCLHSAICCRSPATTLGDIIVPLISRCSSFVSFRKASFDSSGGAWQVDLDAGNVNDFGLCYMKGNKHGEEKVPGTDRAKTSGQLGSSPEMIYPVSG